MREPNDIKYFGELDYDPFGMILKGRSNALSGENYRFDFNGKESDSDPYGEGNIYDYGFRIYNPRLGKFLSVDPLRSSYPWYTPYQFAGNKPIKFIDLDGLEEHDPTQDAFLSVRLVVTAFYDLKHAIENTGAYIVWGAQFSGPLPQVYVPLYHFDYATDANGNQIFETVCTKSYQSFFSWRPHVEAAFNVITIATAGDLKTPTDFLAVKTNSSNQVTKAIKSSILYKAEGLVKDANLQGNWGKVARNENGMDYQSWVSGKTYNKVTKEIEEFNYNGTNFDGYSNGMLYEAKDNYANFIDPNTGEFESWFQGKADLINEARNQIAAANGVHLRWTFSQKESLEATRKLFEDAGIDVTKIEFMYMPKQ